MILHCCSIWSIPRLGFNSVRSLRDFRLFRAETNRCWRRKKTRSEVRRGEIPSRGNGLFESSSRKSETSARIRSRDKSGAEKSPLTRNTSSYRARELVSRVSRIRALTRSGINGRMSRVPAFKAVAYLRDDVLRNDAATSDKFLPVVTSREQ